MGGAQTPNQHDVVFHERQYYAFALPGVWALMASASALVVVIIIGASVVKAAVTEGQLVKAVPPIAIFLLLLVNLAWTLRRRMDIVVQDGRLRVTAPGRSRLNLRLIYITSVEIADPPRAEMWRRVTFFGFWAHWQYRGERFFSFVNSRYVKISVAGNVVWVGTRHASRLASALTNRVQGPDGPHR